MAGEINFNRQAATYFDEQLKEPVRQMLIGRQLFAKQEVLGPDKYRVNFNKIVELGAAQAGRAIPAVGSGKDRLTLTPSEIDMILFWKEYEISKMDWDLWTSKGLNPGTTNVISAAQVVGVLEDSYLINGWKPDATNYIEKGIYQIADNTATGAVTSTFGNATICISNAWDKLDEDNITGCNYNFLMHPTNFNEARKARSTNGVREWPDLLDLLNPYPNMPKGDIVKVFGGNLTVDTAVMAPVDPVGKYMDLVIGANYINDVYQNGPSAQFSPVGGITVSSLIARFTRPAAICTVTSM
jgi:uncharacterized linocin/CFP29 family protein